MSVTVLNTLDAKEQFTDLVNRVVYEEGRVILTRGGKEIAAIVPLSDLLLLKESQDRYDLADAIDALAEAREGGMLTLDQLKEDMGM